MGAAKRKRGRESTTARQNTEHRTEDTREAQKATTALDIRSRVKSEDDLFDAKAKGKGERGGGVVARTHTAKGNTLREQGEERKGNERGEGEG